MLTRPQLFQCPHFRALHIYMQLPSSVIQTPYIFKQSNMISVLLPLDNRGLGCWNINAPFACPLFGSHFRTLATTVGNLRLSPVESSLWSQWGCSTHTFTSIINGGFGITCRSKAYLTLPCKRALSFSDTVSHLWGVGSLFALTNSRLTTHSLTEVW